MIIRNTKIFFNDFRPIRYAANEVKGFAERALAMADIAKESLKDTVVAEKPIKRYIKREPLGTILVIIFQHIIIFNA